MQQQHVGQDGGFYGADAGYGACMCVAYVHACVRTRVHA